MPILHSCFEELFEITRSSSVDFLLKCVTLMEVKNNTSPKRNQLIVPNWIEDLGQTLTSVC